ncbi:CoA transferase [Entomohabitans teleogrylli]|uniref:CoA transferase n=1 Tax=Entomohabitans teleogrylli TaxID=1384589 RepID=UPI00073D29E8|nr:CoA transferase [Entomohabitans teleogrylli]
MSDASSPQRLFAQLHQQLHGVSAPPPEVHFDHSGALPSCFAVSALASASIALVGSALVKLTRRDLPLRVDHRLASMWFSTSHQPVNRRAQKLWDPFAGDYATRDGWIRLHTNAPHHRQAMESVLGKYRDRETLANQVAQWRKETLEENIVAAGGCAAAMRSMQQWQRHPQGQAVSDEALIASDIRDGARIAQRMSPLSRPLLGVRVLDLTRIIAGPVATRLLAGLGATVLRIDPPDWREPALEEELTPGKRCARLDLKSSQGREQLAQLVRNADIVVHGYRADALEKLGFDADTLRQLSPGLVDISLNAWGWRGPWRNRRGFDSLVQMACGIAAEGQRWKQTTHPQPLPVQALDHATGYLMAAAALNGLYHREHLQQSYQAQLSLAATAHFLMQQTASAAGEFQPWQPRDCDPALEFSRFGLGYRLRFPLELPGTPVCWSREPVPLGSALPCWP